MHTSLNSFGTVGWFRRRASAHSLALFTLSLLLCISAFDVLPAAYGAGPMGHYLLGKQLISNIESGGIQVDPELRSILKHSDAKRAFEGGCVGPDIAEEQSHYGDTATLARNMLSDARARYKKAASSKDEAAFAKARQELAFAYGWYSHCATDLNVHPKVNAVVGDTYRFNTPIQKGVHAAQESQLTAYLRSVIGQAQYDIYVPYDFLSKHVGLSVDQLKANDSTVRKKVVGELLASSKVEMNDKIKAKWRESVTQSLRESEMLLKNPEAMQNWDLDCGKISTVEFDNFRKLVMEANGGKLPADWGKNYMSLYNKTRGLPGAQQVEAIKSLLTPSSSSSVTAVKGSAKTIQNSGNAIGAITKPTYEWVLTTYNEFPFKDATYNNSGSKGKYDLLWESKGCYAQGCPGEALSVTYSCSKPPAVIQPDQRISLELTASINQNTVQHYSCNTNMDVFFDRADIEPGSYGGGPGLGGLKISGRDKMAPSPLVVSGSPGKAYESVGKMALIVAMYNGRSAGTRYIYEWKPVNRASSK